MTYEEMQRMMEFILEQQAQLTANQQRADERAARADEHAARVDERIAISEERINRANKLITKTARTVDRLAIVTVERTSELDAKFAALVDAQMRTEEAVKRLSERGEETDEAVRKTNESVRTLSDVVDRHLRDHRNGERDVSRE